MLFEVLHVCMYRLGTVIAELVRGRTVRDAECDWTTSVRGLVRARSRCLLHSAVKSVSDRCELRQT